MTYCTIVPVYRISPRRHCGFAIGHGECPCGTVGGAAGVGGIGSVAVGGAEGKAGKSHIDACRGIGSPGTAVVYGGCAVASHVADTRLSQTGGTAVGHGAGAYGCPVVHVRCPRTGGHRRQLRRDIQRSYLTVGGAAAIGGKSTVTVIGAVRQSCQRDADGRRRTFGPHTVVVHCGHAGAGHIADACLRQLAATIVGHGAVAYCSEIAAVHRIASRAHRRQVRELKSTHLTVGRADLIDGIRPIAVGTQRQVAERTGERATSAATRFMGTLNGRRAAAGHITDAALKDRGTAVVAHHAFAGHDVRLMEYLVATSRHSRQLSLVLAARQHNDCKKENRKPPHKTHVLYYYDVVPRQEPLQLPLQLTVQELPQA